MSRAPVRLADPGADRPSVLVMNPDNVEASIRRRQRLVDALDHMDGDAVADLIQLVERLAHTYTTGLPWAGMRQPANMLIDELYQRAGFEDEVSDG
jgi:hypothetical protein